MKNVLEKKIADYVRFMFPRITVSMGSYVANARCHHNAKQSLEEGKSEGIAMVVLIEDDWVVAHFINTKGKRFIENTLGYTAKHNEYYLVKVLSKDETDRISDMLLLFQRQLIRNALSLPEQMIYRITGGKV